jgi:hypothetical protein
MQIIEAFFRDGPPKTEPSLSSSTPSLPVLPGVAPASSLSSSTSALPTSHSSSSVPTTHMQDGGSTGNNSGHFLHMSFLDWYYMDERKARREEIENRIEKHYATVCTHSTHQHPRNSPLYLVTFSIILLHVFISIQRSTYVTKILPYHAQVLHSIILFDHIIHIARIIYPDYSNIARIILTIPLALFPNILSSLLFITLQIGMLSSLALPKAPKKKKKKTVTKFHRWKVDSSQHRRTK